MKSIKFLPVFFLLSLLISPQLVNAQDGHLAFKEIIHGNHFGSTNTPDKIELDVNEGVVEFSIRQKNNCTDRYRFTYRFFQDMNTLEVPEGRNSLPTYKYEFELKPLGSPCLDLNVTSMSNPYIQVTHWNASSGLLGNMKKDNTWSYKHHQQFIDKGSSYYYAHKMPGYEPAGKGTGEFEITGPNKKDVEYYLENYPGIVTDFRILFSGQSSIGKEEAFYYNILFVYELAKGTPVITKDPCDIKQPDCSCCPGTIPVWNFQINKGDCICPEGKVWDKIQNRCVVQN